MISCNQPEIPSGYSLVRRQDTSCPFCEFSDHDVLVASDELVFAIVSRDPINQHHVLVIPRAHYESFAELPPEVATQLWSVAQGVSAAIRRVAQPDGITHISEDDFGSGQLNLVRHYKLHIIPRFRDDGCSLSWRRPPDPGQAARSELARAIREHL